jgi:hypothetical protein
MSRFDETMGWAASPSPVISCEGREVLQRTRVQRLVCGNCLTVVAQWHIAAVQHRAVMGIKRQPVERVDGRLLSCVEGQEGADRSYRRCHDVWKGKFYF